MQSRSIELDTAVNLVHNILVGISHPVGARVGHLGGDGVLLDALRLNDELHEQTGRRMPRDVAVERPHTGVGRIELHHNVPIGLDLLHVAALRVARVGDGAVPGEAGSGGQHVHVVSVQVDRVRGGAVVANDHAHAAVGAQVAHVVERIKGQVACVGLQQGRVVVVHAGRLVVKVPECDAGCVGEERNVVCVRVGRVWHCHREHGLGQRQGVVSAGAWVGDVPRGGCGRFGRVSPVIVNGGDGVGLVGGRAGSDVGAHPKGRSRRTGVGGNENIGALADTEGHDLSGVRLNSDEVVGDDCHAVTVNGEALNTLGARVD